MNPFQQPGAFSWCELMTSDPAAAQEFYGALLGWTLKEGPMQGIPYTVIEAGGQEIGGMTGMPPNSPAMPPTWGVYITVADVDATAEKAKALGGKVLMPPMDLESVGRFALIQDPQGATFYAIAYQTPPGTEGH
jgi:predicted enzyme related to lactoylglutathione lyase